MIKSNTQPLIKSISVWAFDPQRPAREVFALARKHGFEGVELSIGEAGFPLSFQVTAQSTPEDARRLRDEADDAGVRLVSLASGLGWNYPLTSQRPEIRARGLEAARAQIVNARNLGLDAILLVPGGVGADFIEGFEVTPYDVAWENSLSALKELAPVAEEHGVSIGVENVWNKFLLSPLEFRAFLDAVNSPRVGCYFDVGNAVAFGYPAQWVSILGDRITRVHFKDFKREIGTLDGFCALGEGDSDYPAVMAALEKANYTGPVTAEFFGCEADLAAISRAMDAILER